MAEYQHDSAIGSWYFQAVVESGKLDRMVKNARAAHWNKPRAVRYRQSADIGTTQTADAEDTHQLLLSGVRVIRGQQSPFAPETPAETYRASDVHHGEWIGDPQLLFPTGQGLAPFTRRPIVTANAVNFEIEKTNPLPGIPPADDAYDFVNWFGGLDWGAATGTSPEGISYAVNALFDANLWARAVVSRPHPTTHTGQAGAIDLHYGIRFRIMFGRLAGSYVHRPLNPLLFTYPRAYYIHWQAMGPVAVF